jgi:hypothetical protein
MDEFTEADVRKIEQIHSNWIKFEVAGEDDSLLALCADDILRKRQRTFGESAYCALGGTER